MKTKKKLERNKLFLCGCLGLASCMMMPAALSASDALSAGVEMQQQTKNMLTGVVLDEFSEPLPGAQIQVKGTTRGVITGLDGDFQIEVKSGEVLVFSYLGYKKLEQIYKGEKVVSIKMIPDSEVLEDVVIIGYGQQKKNSVVSSINSIGNEELSISSTRSLSNSLAGKLPGLISVQRSGEPGYDNSEFWIRGVSSFSGGTTPLVLVDGVPRSMNDIEPDEIESFTLLKDAAATAVYGAEGANGVILITSKRGSADKPKISFRAEGTIASPTRLPDFVNSEQYLTLFNEALMNEGKEPIFDPSLYAEGADRDLYPNSQWLDFMLRDYTYNMRYTLNVRGGTERARYFVSGAFYQENGIFKEGDNNEYNNNIGVKRYNLRSNIDFDVTKTTLVKVDISGQYLQNNYPGVGTQRIFELMCLTPPYVMPPVYSDGTIAANPASGGINPYNNLMNSGYTKEWRTYIQSKVEVEQKLDFLTKGLSWRGMISFDADMSYTAKRSKSPSEYYATGRDENGNLIFEQIYQGSDALSESLSSSSNKKIYFETSFNYNRTFADKHDVGAMLLYMQKETQYQDNALPYRKQGIVGRVTYGYDGRYFLEGNFGYTGSETFAAGHRFGFFPAVGLAWYLSNEYFYPDALKNVVNKLKVRLSVGRTGNDDTGGDRFLYRQTMNQGANGYNLGFGDSGALGGVGNGIVEGRFAAPYLGWEIEDKRNIGLDLGFFDNRIDIQVDYFNNRRKSILLQRKTVSNVTGFQQMPWQNFGIVDNQGLDGSITLNQKIGEVNLSARGNVTFARNKIVEYDEVPQLYDWMNVTGTRLNGWNIYIADGLYTDDDFIITGEGADRTYELKEGVPSGLSAGVMPGDIKYKDLNGDGLINSYDQVQDVGNPSVPELVYGFGLNAEWKGWYAGIFFQGAGKTSTVLSGATFFPFEWGVDESNARVEVWENRWTQENPNPNAMFPRLHSTTFANNTAASTFWMRDASFIRLKNIELGYNFSKNVLSKLGIQDLRIYLQGNNLYVWDDIKMWDPEQGNANGGLTYPLSRSFTLGVDFTF